MSSDTSALEIVGADYDVPDVEHFGWNFVEQGILTTSWNHKMTDPRQFVQEGSVRMFSLEIKAKRPGNLSEMIGISPRMLVAEAYGLDQQFLDIAFIFDQNQPHIIEEVAKLQLFQNKPNPFHIKMTIGFVLPAATDLTFSIHNRNGKVIYKSNGYYEKGEHQIVLEREDLPAGMMYYTGSTDKESSTEKMILL